MPISVETPKIKSKEDIQIELLKEINDKLTNISEDQKHIGEYVGENIHSIKKWVFIFVVLTIINSIIALLF